MRIDGQVEISREKLEERQSEDTNRLTLFPKLGYMHSISFVKDFSELAHANEHKKI